MKDFHKTIYYIEGINLMVGEVNDINKYNLLVQSCTIYDDLDDALKAIIKKIDIYIDTNEEMIRQLKDEINKNNCIDFETSVEYIGSIKHLKKQISKYQSKKSYYEQML